MEKEELIVYLDDSGDVCKAYSKNIKIENGVINFQTDDNIITIPLHRLLKIKRKVANEHRPANLTGERR